MRFTRVVLYRAGSCKIGCAVIDDSFRMTAQPTIKPTIGLNNRR